MAGCATNIVRYLFFGFNLIFWILGIVVFAIGIYSRVENDTWKDLIDINTLFAAANLLIASGVIVAIIGFFGCCGAIKKVKWMLGVYCGLVVLIFILEVAAGGYAYQNREQVEEKLTSGLQKAVHTNYGDDSNIASKGLTKAVDWFQQTVKCCGVSNATDWGSSKYHTALNITSARVPDSCCKTETAGCGATIADYNDAKIYTAGCVPEGKEFAKSNLYLIGGVGVGIAIVELLAIVFGVCLICAFKKEDTAGETA
jgi:hypothetical protein